MLAALTDGEAGPETVALVAPHMRSCLSCRARLKTQRAAAGRSGTGRGRVRVDERVQ
jgi:hypothetical protein